MRAEGANHDSACRRQRLLSSPKRIFALLSARNDQAVERDAILCKSNRIGRAFFRKRRLFARPENRTLANPSRSQSQGKTKSRRLKPRSRRANLVQGLASQGRRYAREAGFPNRFIG